jgi:hypothetical protein
MVSNNDRNALVTDGMSNMLLGISVGFLINLMLGVALPEIGAFIAGLVAGVVTKMGPVRGAIVGFLAGSIGGIASIALWIFTNLFSMPGPLLPVAFETAVMILTATSAILALSGGIVGGVISLQHWPVITRFFAQHNFLPFHLHHRTTNMTSNSSE